jgi:hypothetical protein
MNISKTRIIFGENRHALSCSYLFIYLFGHCIFLSLESVNDLASCDPRTRWMFEPATSLM